MKKILFFMLLFVLGSAVTLVIRQQQERKNETATSSSRVEKPDLFPSQKENFNGNNFNSEMLNRVLRERDLDSLLPPPVFSKEYWPKPILTKKRKYLTLKEFGDSIMMSDAQKSEPAMKEDSVLQQQDVSYPENTNHTVMFIITCVITVITLLIIFFKRPIVTILKHLKALL